MKNLVHSSLYDASINVLNSEGTSFYKRGACTTLLVAYDAGHIELTDAELIRAFTVALPDRNNLQLLNILQSYKDSHMRNRKAFIKDNF